VIVEEATERAVVALEVPVDRDALTATTILLRMVVAEEVLAKPVGHVLVEQFLNFGFLLVDVVEGGFDAFSDAVNDVFVESLLELPSITRTELRLQPELRGILRRRVIFNLA